MNICFQENVSRRLELCLGNGASLIQLNDWRSTIQSVLLHFGEKKRACLVILNAPKNSIAFELEGLIRTLKIERRSYQYTLINITKNTLEQLFSDDGFYLGDLILGFVSAGEEEAFLEQIDVLDVRRKSLFDSFVTHECVFMENDGNSLCWLNPKFTIEKLEKYIKLKS